MNKKQKASLALFIIFIFVSIVISNMIAVGAFEMSSKPWQMQADIDENVLTQNYLDEFKILEKARVSEKNSGITVKYVNILVDAWGVPFNIVEMREDLAMFGAVPHKQYLHKRIANRTRHAEFVELRNSAGNGVYLFGGDSLEYGRNLYIDSLGYSEKVFCQRCEDKVMFNKLDSILQNGNFYFLAMTTQDSREGLREKLHGTLTLIAALAKKYPDVHFVVQGTHRPILGDPNIRRKHFAKWVPLVILN